MPVPNDQRQRGSGGGSSRPHSLRYSATFDSAYGQDESYTTNPDLNSSGDSKDDYRRYSYTQAEDVASVRSGGSCDSLDGIRPPVTRPSNTAKTREENIPTRPMLRKSSTATSNPLQFIKAESNPLVVQATKLVSKMEEQKKVTVKMESFDDDWQSNLSSWKNRRKKKSETLYTNLDSQSFDKEPEVAVTKKNKTFKEMMEERGRRKSSYLYDDVFTSHPDKTENNDSSIFEDQDRVTSSRTSFSNSQKSASKLSDDDLENLPKERKKSVQEEEIKEVIAPWAESPEPERKQIPKHVDTKREEMDNPLDYLKDDTLSPSSTLSSLSKTESLETDVSRTEHIDERGDSMSRESAQYNVTTQSSFQNKKSFSSSMSSSEDISSSEERGKKMYEDLPPGRVTGNRKAFEASTKAGDTEKPTKTFEEFQSRRVTANRKVFEDQNKTDHQEKKPVKHFEEFKSKSVTTNRMAFEGKPKNEPGRRSSKHLEEFNNSRRVSTNRLAFEDMTRHEPEVGRPSKTLEEFKSRRVTTNRQAFEEMIQHEPDTEKPTKTIEELNTRRVSTNRLAFEEMTRYDHEPDKPTKTFPEFQSKSVTKNRKAFEEIAKSTDKVIEHQPLEDMPSKRAFDDKRCAFEAQSSVQDDDYMIARRSSSGSVYTNINNNNRQADVLSAETMQSEKSAYYQAGENEQEEIRVSVSELRKNFIEKTIRINQTPGSDQGFGFLIKGGKEYEEPIAIDSLTPGGAAEACELEIGDEVLCINDEDITQRYQGSVSFVIKQCLNVGYIELLIRRYHNESQGKAERRHGTVSNPLIQSSVTEAAVLQGQVTETTVQQSSVTDTTRSKPEPQSDAVQDREAKHIDTDPQPHTPQKHSVQNDAAPESPEHSVETEEEYDELLEQEIMDRLAREEEEEQDMERRHQQIVREESFDQIAEMNSSTPITKSSPYGAPLATPDTPDEPPPLPGSAPPPLPMWSFPRNESLDASSSDLKTTEETPSRERQSDPYPATEKVTEKVTAILSQDTTTLRIRMETLQRKAEFLGLNPKELEELKKLESAIEEGKTSSPDEHSFSRFTWQQETSTSVRMKPHHDNDDITQEELEILANLELEEQQKEMQFQQHQQPQQHQYPVIDQQLSASESVTQSSAPSPRHEQEMSFRSRIDNKDEEDRLKRWQDEQERIIQSPNENHQSSVVDSHDTDEEKYANDQEMLKRTFAEDYERAEKISFEKHEEERQILEREAQKMAEMEEQRRKLQEEERRKREEDAKKFSESKQQHKILMDDRRKIIKQQEELYMQEIQREKEEEEAIKKKQAELRRQEELEREKKRKEEEERLEKERMRLENERRQKEEEERKRLLEQRRRKEEEQRRREEEQRKREEEQRRQKEEKRRKEEEEQRQLREKEEQLRAMEERIQREQEQLRLERERLLQEKTQHSRMWSRPASYHGGAYLVSDEQYAASSSYHSRHRDQNKDYLNSGVDYSENYNSPMDRKPSAPVRGEELFERSQKNVLDNYSGQKMSFTTHVDTLSRKAILEMSKKPGLSPGKFQDPPPEYAAGAVQLNQTPYRDQNQDEGFDNSNKLRKHDSYSAYSTSNMSDSDAAFPHQGSVELNRRPPNKWEHYDPSMEHEIKDTSREDVSQVVRRAPVVRRGEEQRRKERPSSGSWETSSQASLRSEAISASRRAAPVPKVASKPPQQRPASFHAALSTSSTSQGVIEPMSKKTLHNINAAPKSRMRDDWRSPTEDRPTHSLTDYTRRSEDDHRKQLRRSEIMRREMPNTQDHWLVEEAERRRQREKYGSPNPYEQPIPPAGDRLMPPIVDRERDSSRSPPAPNQGATHIMEHVQQPVHGRPGKPLPEAIKQTLMQRVNTQLKSPSQGQQHPIEANYNPAYHPHNTAMTPDQVPPLPARHYYEDNNTDMNRYPPQQLSHGGSTSSLQHQGYAVNGAKSPQYSSDQPPAKPPRTQAGGSGSADECQDHAEQVVSVSGKQRCSHCQKPLGHGAAMIIESLGLHYHVQCFRCCVCHSPLGDGQKGTDVRVRVSKLHCQNCYSNDEGIKYSRV